jgi:hypothetical protein
MMRAGYACAAMILAFALAAPAGAQSDVPSELWSEYPLVQKVQGAKPTGVRPSLPPKRANPQAAPQAAPVSDESTGSGTWLTLLVLASIAAVASLAVAARTDVGVAGLRAVGRGVRELPGRAPRPTRVRKPATTPSPLSASEPDLEREPRYYIVPRRGLLRSRFVVVADEPGGKVSRIASSRSFWKGGPRDKAAEEAWAELMEDLRATGWEPYSERSDFYVLLRRTGPGEASIVPTIEAYTHTSDRPNGR